MPLLCTSEKWTPPQHSRRTTMVLAGKSSHFTIGTDLIDPPCSEGECDAGQEFPDSAPSISGSTPGSPTFSLEGLEFEEAQQNPVKLKLPVTRYHADRRVHGETEHGFPAIPPLEPSLASVLLHEATFFSRSHPVPPSPRDQVTTCLTDCAHQCTDQMAAAINNVALLSSSVSSIKCSSVLSRLAG
ncbi:hypothetical protein Q5P01_003205 [Channa striata]|uniref:Uncharacterized protein n=1 Tax=Channa striata TaxID=64152 RepID=A0AA88T2K0_CHASR|nr:hypothetical protein Q5P01_003205 [Channa striata]